METIDYISIISIAFIGSFGHCIGMCGGIVFAYSSTKIEDSWTKKRQSIAHIFYSIGRISTYTSLGAIFGFLGSVVSFSSFSNGVLLVLVGLIMFLIGISLSGKIKFLNYIEHSIQNSAWYHKSFRSLLQSNSLKSFYLLGVLNGMLPCGLVYFFAITAAGTASTLDGALIMFLFGLSTMPAVFSLGFFVGIFKQNTLRKSFIQLTSIGVILYSMYMMYTGFTYISTQKNSPTHCEVIS